ncbi:MAG: MBL fold metallo-hydrolase [Bacteroidetes bacterium]|nr:MAG: MBL fold metallo-hydrolase [Bacteroidota bacterium]
MKNILTLLVFLSLLTGCRDKASDIRSDHFDLIPLADGVYACIHKLGGQAICNVGIIDNGTETIIFDSFLSPEAAKELPPLAERLGLSPIRYVINSHAHNDHIRGNQVFSPDTDIISTSKTAELIAKWEPEEIAAEKNYAPVEYARADSMLKAFSGDTSSLEFQNLRLLHPYFATLARSHTDVQTRLPNVFVNDTKSLDGPMRKVQLLTRGAGHTESDLVLYLPDEHILFSGDLIFNGMHPYLADGDPEKLMEWLGYLETLEVRTIVPGHGSVGDARLITNIKTYLYDLEGIVQQLHKKGTPPDQAGEIPIPPVFRDWWLDRFFTSNIRFLYSRMAAPD